VGILASLVVITVGIIGIVVAVEFPPPLNWYYGPFNMELWIKPYNEDFASAEIAACLCLFGVLSLLGEFKFHQILRYFSFMGGYLGRGLFYVFLGTLCLGIAGNIGLIGGLSVFAVGVVQIFSSIFCYSCLERQKKREKYNQLP